MSARLYSLIPRGLHAAAISRAAIPSATPLRILQLQANRRSRGARWQSNEANTSDETPPGAQDLHDPVKPRASDLPWFLAAVAVTVPSLYLILGGKPEKGHGEGHGAGHGEEEHAEEEVEENTEEHAEEAQEEQGEEQQPVDSGAKQGEEPTEDQGEQQQQQQQPADNETKQGEDNAEKHAEKDQESAPEPEPEPQAGSSSNPEAIQGSTHHNGDRPAGTAPPTTSEGAETQALAARKDAKTAEAEQATTPDQKSLDTEE